MFTGGKNVEERKTEENDGEKCSKPRVLLGLHDEKRINEGRKVY